LPSIVSAMMMSLAGEARVELGEREHHLVSVLRAGQHVMATAPPLIAAERNARLAEDVRHQHALVAISRPSSLTVTVVRGMDFSSDGGIVGGCDVAGHRQRRGRRRGLILARRCAGRDNVTAGRRRGIITRISLDVLTPFPCAPAPDLTLPLRAKSPVRSGREARPGPESA
jgi:hypothetical protein